MTRVFVAVLLAMALAGWATNVHAQKTPSNYPVVVVMDGPTSAVSSEEITYTLRYRILDPALAGSGVRIIIPLHVTFLSNHVVAGPPARLPSGPHGDTLEWSGLGTHEEPEGAVELTLRIDDSYVGPIRVGCSIPGTETGNPEDRCSITTQVYAPGTLPVGGSGPSANGLGAYVWLLALIGGALLAGGAVASLYHSLARDP